MNNTAVDFVKYIGELAREFPRIQCPNIYKQKIEAKSLEELNLSVGITINDSQYTNGLL